MTHKRNKYGNKTPEIKVNGERIPIDPETNYAEFEFIRSKRSWYHFLEMIPNIQGKWINKVVPKFPDLINGQIVMKYYSDDFSHLVDIKSMHDEILANHPFLHNEFFKEPNLKKLLKEAGYIDRTVDEYIEESEKYFKQIANNEIKPYKDKLHQAGWLNKETGEWDMNWV